MTTEQQQLAKRAKLFATYVGAEIKGAIMSRGLSQGAVADGIKRPRPTLNNWLNNKTPLAVEDALIICDYIGVQLTTIAARANKRVDEELGPWPPITVNPDAMSEEEKKRLIMEKVRRGDMSLAANYDPDKEAERDYYPDAGA